MIEIVLKNIDCIVETDEVGDDEPYVLVTAVNLASTITVAESAVPIPSFEVVRYGPFEDVAADDPPIQLNDPVSFWDLTGNPAALSDPDSVIFVMALVENDDGDPEALRGIVKGLVSASLIGSLGFDRDDKVKALINDINSGLGVPTGFPNFDDKVGKPEELKFSAEELILANTIFGVTKTLIISGDGGRYSLTFEARNPAAISGQEKGFNIQQESSRRFVDAYESPGQDFSVVTRTAQNNDTQRWILNQVGGVYTIQQKSNGRFLDAHEAPGEDFSLVTRAEQNNDSQRWVILPNADGTSIIRQLSSGRFVDAHETQNADFSVVTRTAQNDRTQRWIITYLADGTAHIQQSSNRRFIDAHESTEHDFSVVTRIAQKDDTQRWILNQIGGVYTIQQKSNGRFLDAHETPGEDFSLVMRDAQNDDTQRWIIIPHANNTSTIQQLSNRQFVDAHETSGADFSVVTRTAQNNSTQQWRINSA